MNSVSIMIPTHNRRESLALTLTSLCHQLYPASLTEVIVVDNGSTDGTIPYLQSLATPYRLVVVHAEKQKPYEYARLRNVGIRAAGGDLLIFLDSDMVVTRRFVQQHAGYHRPGVKTAVLGKMIHLDSNARLDAALLARDYEADDLGKWHLAGNSVQKFLAVSGNLPQYLRPWDFCIGANFSVSREALDAGGLFDESLDGDLPVGADIAYGLQLHARGVRLVYGRGAIGFHQRNHAIFRHEAPAYVARRTASVLSREDEVHAKWLDEDDWTLVRDQIARKRRLTTRLEAVGGRLTLAGERGPLARLAALRQDNRLCLSVFVLASSSSAAVAATLEALARQHADADAFEAIVLDPGAPVAHGDDAYDVAMDATVQHTQVSYLLRYFPAERAHHTAPRRAADGGGAAAAPGHGRLIASERQWFERYIRGLLLEKPLAPVALTIEAGQEPPPSFVSEVARAVSD